MQSAIEAANADDDPAFKAARLDRERIQEAARIMREHNLYAIPTMHHDGIPPLYPTVAEMQIRWMVWHPSLGATFNYVNMRGTPVPPDEQSCFDDPIEALIVVEPRYLILLDNETLERIYWFDQRPGQTVLCFWFLTDDRLRNVERWAISGKPYWRNFRGHGPRATVDIASILYGPDLVPREA